MNRKDDDNWFESVQAELARMQFLAQNQVDPRLYLTARRLAAAGSGLGQRWHQELLRRALANQVRMKYYVPPAIDPTRDLVLGYLCDRPVPVGVPLTSPVRILVAGSSGSGKTNAIFHLLAQLRRRSIKTFVWEYKPELRRVIPWWNDAILFTPRNAPWQYLKPVGPDPLAYYVGIFGEIRIEFQLRPETVPLAWQIIERMLRGMRPGDPFFSWSDLERVFEAEAVAQGRENLFTLARAILSICTVLGPQAAAREVPDITGRYNVIGYSFVGQDPAIYRLFLGFEFTRLLFSAEEQGHTTEFRRLYVFDEGSVIFGSELMQRGVAHISAAKRFLSMSRFTGSGFVVGVQNLCELDPFVTQNCDTFVVFRCPSFEDATLAARMLGLEPSAVDELMHLPVGVALIRAADWERPVKIQVPLFEP